MATAVSTEKLFANCKIESFIHMTTSNATEQSVKAGATDTTWKDLRDYEGFDCGRCARRARGYWPDQAFDLCRHG